MILLARARWEIKSTPSKGRGLFATKPITKGEVIGDYIGKVIHPQDAIINEENFYLMYYHDRAVITPNVAKPGVHLLNHACVPNSWLYIYKGHTLAFALRRVSIGEELTISYMLAPNEYCQPCQHICKCGDVRCSGTMHLSKEVYSAWKEINEAQARETKKERVSYGRELPLLSSYPKTISEDYMRKIKRLLGF